MPPPPPVDCLHGDVGPSNAASFVSLEDDPPNSFLTLRADCSATYQEVNGAARGATLSDDDCAAIARWATSEHLDAALANGSACYPSDGNIEVVAVTTTSGGVGGRKLDASCALEPFASERACMAAIRKTYFDMP